MTVTAGFVKANLQHKCRKCRSEMLLPEWVALAEDSEVCLFQCPVCNREAEIDISDYPKTRMRVVVNDYRTSTNGKGGD